MKNNSPLIASRWEKSDRALRFSSLVTKSRPWPVIGRTIFFTSGKNRPTNQKPAITHRDEIYFIAFWRENLSMYRIMWNPMHLKIWRNRALGIFTAKEALKFVAQERGNTRNKPAQLATQPCCATSCTKNVTRITEPLQLNHSAQRGCFP